MGWKIWTALALALALALPAGAQTRLLDPNSATEQQLAAVPGLGPLAAQIVAKRPYASPTAFDAVLAAGNLTPQQRTQIYLRAWVPMNLNTATPQDIMLIPGMSARMMNEFREYKPYKSIGQFRYEIGKYVPKTEVARLEQYVLVPK
jgi:DNA uptake protein ComE-like DNA-binding protein